MAETDWIDRQDALDNITQEVIGEVGSVSGVYFGSKDFVWIEERLYLPVSIIANGVKETQKKGEWIDDGDPLTFTCSKCGYLVARHNNTNFCPNCGADMRGE